MRRARVLKFIQPMCLPRGLWSK